MKSAYMERYTEDFTDGIGRGSKRQTPLSEKRIATELIDKCNVQVINFQMRRKRMKQQQYFSHDWSAEQR